MLNFYNRYQQGFYVEVYDDLLIMEEQLFDSNLYEDSLHIMQEMMKRVRSNIELLIPRLHSLGYIFRKGGFW